MGKCCLHASSFIFDRIIIKVAVNQDRHKSSDEFDFGPDQSTLLALEWRKFYTFELEYLWGQSAVLIKFYILCVASRGGGSGRGRGAGNKKPLLSYNGGKWCLHLFSVVFDPIHFILAGNEDMHKISDEFEFRPDRPTDYGVSCLWDLKTLL